VKSRAPLTVAVLLTLMLVPALAWAGEGSETGKFQEILEKHGAVVAVLASFGFGFIASLTPCVYPMVPITVSIFGATEAKSRLRGAALSGAFVLGIAALFTPMGVLSAMSGKLMGSALSNQWVVLALAALFITLAASMFGAFELALPSGLTNKLSTVGGVGFKGAFIMGLVMGLIAAPCTGPFLTGMVTVIATSKNVALGSAALFSFAMGLGVLFFVAGAFAVSLPKGGAWMMGIKWASGVGLAYMAFAYLRDRFVPIHDLVSHSSTSYGVVAGVLAVVGLGLGVVHMIAERRKSPIGHLSKPMKLASIVPSIAGLVMLISFATTPKGGAIQWLTEIDGRAKAAAESRPVLIDFGATWCAACKELEHNTFPNPDVQAEASRFVAIHVDATDDENAETKRLQEKYKVVGLPTVLLLDKNGNEVVRFNEFVEPDKFVAALKKVASGGNAVGMN
jgi:thioredoxin:protein disulfide reductase